MNNCQYLIYKVSNEIIEILGERGCVGLCLYNKIHGMKDITSSFEPKKVRIKVLEKYFLMRLYNIELKRSQ